MRLTTGLGVMAGAAVLGGTAFLMWPKPPLVKNPGLISGDEHYAAAPAKAEEAYRGVIEQAVKEAPKDKKAQDKAALARLRLGYLAARRKDWKAARAMFLEADRKYAGEGKQGAGFGNAKDQGAYQAAVCLAAAGQESEAKREFLRFIEERPESPLVHAAFKRLRRMNGGEYDPNAIPLMETAVAKQQAKIRFENSVCGPRAAAYALRLLRKGEFDYKALAKRCGTTDRGTTVQGLCKGLEQSGAKAYAYRVNADDLTKTPLPAILLVEGHYVVLEGFEGGAMKVYDTLLEGPSTLPLPDPDASVAPMFDAVLFSAPAYGA